MSCDVPADEKRRKFLLAGACTLGGIGAVCAITPLVASWMPSAKTKAQAGPIQVDVSQIAPGEQLTVEWRGKPVWIIHRTPAMLAHLSEAREQLRDPDSRVAQQPAYAQNQYRSIKPAFLVLVGVCTHLGCTPKYQPTDKELRSSGRGGFYCPCHGSSFDLAGRVFKSMPAPINLAVPPHHFINEHILVIGEDSL